jgi:hypothetical protein
MKLKQRGRYLELPIVGLKVKKILFDGLLTVFLNDEEESFLEFHSTFKVTKHNQTRDIDPRAKDGLIVFHDLIGETIKEAVTDKGVLWLTFGNETEICVEDGPFENWHYTKRMGSDTLFVHGGIGKTSSFDF